MKKLNFTQTDDYQFLAKKNENCFYIIEAREFDEDEYVICKGSIDLRNYMDSDNNYDADAIGIIKSYYDSVENFHENYPDEESRNQILAEMYFESIPHYELDFWIIKTENPENEIIRTIKVMGGTIE